MKEWHGCVRYLKFMCGIEWWLIRSCILLLKFQEDLDAIDRMIADGEATYDKWRHPDPYIGRCCTLIG